MILDDAEVAVVLAILSSVGAAQEHGKQQNARVRSERKEGRSSLSGFPRTRVGAKGLGTYALVKGGRNCEGEASIDDAGHPVSAEAQILNLKKDGT
jgi:hypothetical protein